MCLLRICKRPSLRGALCAPRACVAPRERQFARARLMQPRAWAAPMSGVRDTRCASLLVRAWLQLPRCPPAFRLVFSSFSLPETLPVLASAPLQLLRLCASSRLCAFAPLLWTSLCSSLLSALLFFLLCICFCSRLCLTLVALDSNIYSTLLTLCLQLLR